MVDFRDYDRTTGGYYMGVIPDRIQEEICGSHFSEQYETRVS